MGKMSREEYEVMREKYQISKTYEEMKEENKGIDHPDTLSNAEATVLFIVSCVAFARAFLRSNSNTVSVQMSSLQAFLRI